MTDEKIIDTLKAGIQCSADSNAPSATWRPTPEMCEMIFECAPGGIAVVTLEGEILIANQEGIGMLGYSASNMANRRTKDLYVHPENREELRELLTLGKTVRNYELQLKHKDGSVVYVDLNARPIEYGDKNAVLLAYVNITDLKKTQGDLKETQEGIEGTIKQRTATLEEANAELATLNATLVKKNKELEQAQAALKESESRFRTLFMNKHSIMLIIDPTTGSLVDANPAAELYYGYTASQLKTMNISEINTLSPLEISKEMSRARREKREHFFFKHRLANGEIREVEVFSGPVLSHGRRLLYSIIHDITQRKEAEAQKVLYKHVLESTPDLISLVDRDYYYRMVNDAYLETFKKKREEIVHRSVPELVGQEFFEEKSKPYLDKALGGETIHTRQTLETPRMGKIHLGVVYHPVKDSDDEIKYVSINARNITAIKENEDALKMFSDRLALATDAGKIGIWEWDLTTNNIIWDEMMMELYKVDESKFSAMYDAWRTRVHPDDLADAEHDLNDAVTKNIPFDSEFRIIWPDGEIRHIKAAALVQHEDGEAKRLTGVNWDVTKRRRMEQELRDLASTDPLTGANNRRHFMERIHEETERSFRHSSPMSILTLDIDLFKDVNDTYGHPVGDIVLKELVAICQKTLRITDIFSRMGGEEFSAILRFPPKFGPLVKVESASLNR